MRRSVRYILALCGLVLTAGHEARSQGTIVGVVRDSAGKPVANAAILIERASRQSTSDASGNYTLRDIPAGLHLVQFRAIGFLPAVATASLSDGQTKQLDFVATRMAQSLDTVVVKDRVRTTGVGLAAFEERRERGFGKFIDAEELRKNEHRRVSDMLVSMPGISLVKPRRCRSGRPPDEKCDSNSNKRIAMRGRGAPCAMQIILDGTTVFRGDGRPVPDNEFDWEGAWDLSTTSVSELAGVEVYRSPSEVPSEFGGAAAGCGVILLWTRR